MSRLILPTRRGLIAGAATLAAVRRANAASILLTGAGPGAAAVANTLDPATNATTITMSGGNMVATSSSSTWGTVRTSIGKASGKWYAEYKVTAGSDGLLMIGLCDDATAGRMNNYAGNFPNSAASSTAVGGVQINGMTSGGGPNWTTGALNVVMGVAFDADAGKAWFADNNSWKQGSPSSGASPSLTWSTPKNIFPCVALFTSGDQVNYSGPSTTYSPPSGFSVLQ